MEIYPLTKLTKHNPLWKVQAWCRRNTGRYFLFQEDNGNVVVTTDPGERINDQILETWQDGVRVYRDRNRPEPKEYNLVG